MGTNRLQFNKIHRSNGETRTIGGVLKSPDAHMRVAGEVTLQYISHSSFCLFVQPLQSSGVLNDDQMIQIYLIPLTLGVQALF